jgi:uncharacterized protein (TIGR02391 family)
MDAQPTREQLILMQAVYDVFSETGTWPLYSYIDKTLDQRHGLNIDEIVAELPKTLIRVSTPSPPENPLVLRVAGLRYCERGEREIALFVHALKWCVAKERVYTPTSPTETEELRVSSEQAREEWSKEGVEVDTAALMKVRALLEAEAVHVGMSWGDASWEITLNRQLRRFRDVRDIDDYLRIVERDEAERQRPRFGDPLMSLGDTTVVVQPPSRVRVIQPGIDAPSTSAVVLTIDDLHPVVRDACSKLFVDEHYRQSVLDASLALRNLVRQKSGRADLDGDALMGAAFGGAAPPLVVADLSTESGRNIQRGTLLLAQGIFARMRNPYSHDNLELDAADALEMLSVISHVVRDVDASVAAAETEPMAAQVDAPA